MPDMGEVFYNFRVGSPFFLIKNQNPEAINEKIDKFDPAKNPYSSKVKQKNPLKSSEKQIKNGKYTYNL